MPAEFTPDDSWREAIAHDCGCELPVQAREAIDLFNRGDYYTQHDLLEALWRDTDSPVRELYRAVLQLGIAYYQVQQGNWRGAMKMVNRSLRWIHLLPDVCQGIDVVALRRNALHLRQTLRALRDGDISTISKDVFRPVPLKST